MSISRKNLDQIIFETDTKSGKRFDIILLWAILFSILAVVLESVDRIQENYKEVLIIAEWCFTILFTIEYIVRIWVVDKPRKYIFSFLGIIDLLSILPTYISLAFVGTQYFVVIRAIRLLRVFRVLKINRFIRHGDAIVSVLRSSIGKISVFLFAILNIVIILGTLMYVIEGEANGFDSIPRSIYWAIVTLTTVGYGDISPCTPLGQFISSIIMIVGYSIIAVPTGIVSAEMVKQSSGNKELCKKCNRDIDIENANYCPHCGEKADS